MHCMSWCGLQLSDDELAQLRHGNVPPTVEAQLYAKASWSQPTNGAGDADHAPGKAAGGDVARDGASRPDDSAGAHAAADRAAAAWQASTELERDGDGENEPVKPDSAAQSASVARAAHQQRTSSSLGSLLLQVRRARSPQGRQQRSWGDVPYLHTHAHTHTRVGVGDDGRGVPRPGLLQPPHARPQEQRGAYSPHFVPRPPAANTPPPSQLLCTECGRRYVLQGGELVPSPASGAAGAAPAPASRRPGHTSALQPQPQQQQQQPQQRSQPRWAQLAQSDSDGDLEAASGGEQATPRQVAKRSRPAAAPVPAQRRPAMGPHSTPHVPEAEAEAVEVARAREAVVRALAAHTAALEGGESGGEAMEGIRAAAETLAALRKL